MKVILITLLSLVALSLCTNTVTYHTILDKYMDAPVKELFKVYHFIFKKSYDLNTQEGINRYKVFKQNLKFINEENSMGNPYELGLNEFADMTAEEFTSKYLNTPEEFKKQMDEKPESSVRFLEFFDDHADDEDVKSAKTEADRAEINWGDKLLGARNQQTCGSCWIFSALSVLEAHTAIQTPNWEKTYFSPQQMLDCLPYSSPCKGGNAVSVFLYAAVEAPKYERHNIGVVADSEYPYLNAKTANGCKDKTGEIKNNVHYKTKSYKYLKAMTSSNIGTWYDYLSKGPVVASIAVCPYVNPKFRLYKSGVLTFELKNCALGPNHAIAIYGWGKADVNGVETEIMYGRNSWGTSWGENGNFRVAYQPEVSNSCWLNSALWAPTY